MSKQNTKLSTGMDAIVSKPLLALDKLQRIEWINKQ